MRTVCSLPDFGLKQRLKTTNKKGAEILQPHLEYA